MNSSTTNFETARARRFVIVFGIPLFAALALAASFSLVVDPNQALGTGIDTFTAYRHHGSRTSKVEQLASGKWKTLVLGDSRAEAGLDPDHLGQGALGFNAALNGAMLHETVDMLDYALTHSQPERLVIAIQLDNLVPNRGRGADYARSRLVYDAELTEYRLQHLISPAALVDGWSVAERWWHGTPSAHRPRGLRVSIGDGTNARKMFAEKLAREVSYQSNFHYDRSGLDRLAASLSVAVDRGIRVDVVISPLHALHLVFYQQQGFGDAYERFQRDLAAMAYTMPEGPGKVAVWDFSGFEGPVAERLPGPEEPTRALTYYHESSHFKPTLGRRLLERLNGAENGFGHRLSVESVEGNLARHRSERAAYHALHPDHAEWVREWTRSAMN